MAGYMCLEPENREMNDRASALFLVFSFPSQGDPSLWDSLSSFQSLWKHIHAQRCVSYMIPLSITLTVKIKYQIYQTDAWISSTHRSHTVTLVTS